MKISSYLLFEFKLRNFPPKRTASRKQRIDRSSRKTLETLKCLTLLALSTSIKFQYGEFKIPDACIFTYIVLVI